MDEGRNDATSCEGTHEVVERHECVCSLGDLVKTSGLIELVKKNGCPSPQLLKLMSNILSDVSNLHDMGKAHRHLCPESILICRESRNTELKKGLRYYAKLRLDSPCLYSSKTGCRVWLWQAPEQRNDRGRLTLSANIYSLGEIFHYCITGYSSKEWQPVRKERDLPWVDCRAAKDLILWSQEENPELRPKANELQHHPLFWTPEGRLSFLHDIMNRPSYLDYFTLWEELKKLSVHEVTGGEWNDYIHDDKVLRYINEQKKEKACNYKFNSVLDLVRLIRNMKEHYRDLPNYVKRSVREPPEDFDSFFTSRFPNLVIEVYKVVRKWRKGKEDEHFRKYFDGGALVRY